MKLIIVIILLALGIYCLFKLLANKKFKIPFKLKKSNSRQPIDLSNALRQPYSNPSSGELDSVKKRLRMLLYGDDDAIKRIIQSERRRNPDKSEVELYKSAIERLERDRGR